MTTIILDSVIYDLSGTNAIVTGFDSPPITWNLVIPSTITNLGTTYNVTSIRYGAFGSSAFGSSSLTSITIPNSVTSIGDGAFSSSSLTSITIPNSVTSIGLSIFYNCRQLRSITLPEFITTIYSDTFYNCYSLQSITIPNSVTRINTNAFQNCTSLTSITLPNSVTEFGSAVFRGCSSLKTATIGNNVTNISNDLFRESGLISITIPDSVTRINGSAFRFCNSLQSVTIGKNVTSIAFAAFGNCSVLLNVKFLGNILPTDELANFGVSGDTALYYLGSSNLGILSNFTNSISVLPPIDNILYSINGSNVTIVGYEEEVNNFNVKIPETIVYLGNIYSVTSINSRAFQNCISLQSITIPNSVTSIGESAFQGCTSLTSITFLGLIPTIGSNNFSITGDNVTYSQALNAENPNLAGMLAMFTTNTLIYPICFPAGTPVETDQGSIAIEKINPSVNTIKGKNIIAITKTITVEDNIVCIEKDAIGPNIPSQKTFISRNHELLYNKQMIKAKNLIGVVDGVYNKKYNGEILYNVLLDKYDKMMVNNLIVETLDPKNIVAQLYNGSLTVEERNIIIVSINQCAKEYKKQFGKMR
jgi:hypothetical protein